MFKVLKPSHPKVTHGKLHRVIVEYDDDGNPTNADVLYKEGYEEDGKFVPLGVNTYHIANTPAETETDEEGNEKVVKPEKKDLDEFVLLVENSTADVKGATYTFLSQKGIAGTMVTKPYPKSKIM